MVRDGLSRLTGSRPITGELTIPVSRRALVVEPTKV